MEEINSLVRKVCKTLKTEGIIGVGKKTRSYLKTAKAIRKNKNDRTFKDVLFINGCDESVPHPARYRVSHQREQLGANNISTSEVYYCELNLDLVRYYRVFVFFRCPYTDTIGEFIKLAKSLNKKVLFDIDDLVIDTKYTNSIEYLNSMTKEERALYDDGVNRMGRTLKLCDAAITTTECLAKELSKYVPEVLINRNTASEEMYGLSKEALGKKNKDKTVLDIGYFSGSLTHNADFELILPALLQILKKYNNVYLHIVGELNLPKSLEKYKERIICHPFMDWRKLPELISSVDINLAPLEYSIFNEAKSENKWVEAALVKVPTVASNVGAFKQMIISDETGILCDTVEDWVKQLSRLIENKEIRERLGEKAYQYCSKNCITTYTGFALTKYIKKYMTPNIAFVLPSLNISGGIMVALWHAIILQNEGWDVFLLNVKRVPEWCQFKGHRIPVLEQDMSLLEGRIDNIVATMWTTVSFIEGYSNVGKRYYLVQNFEPDFYEPGIPLRIFANQSYVPKVPVKFITISKWCKYWLKEQYEQIAQYAPNGIETEKYRPHKRKMKGKIRILIEGDCGVEYKNVDESFQITNRLDSSMFEIWYMSYNAEPKEWYRVDKFLHKVPYEKVSKIYAQCDILLKTSYLESFSYPPLEMMATGGYAVVVPNDGNKEYLKDEENCLLYPLGDIDAGIKAIERICSDPDLRERLYEGGLATAKERDWETIKQEICSLYV